MLAKIKRRSEIYIIWNWTFLIQCVCRFACVGGSVCACVQLCVSHLNVFYASPYLQIKELQAVELVEDVMGQSREPAAVHVEALELL